MQFAVTALSTSKLNLPLRWFTIAYYRPAASAYRMHQGVDNRVFHSPPPGSTYYKLEDDAIRSGSPFHVEIKLTPSLVHDCLLPSCSQRLPDSSSSQ